MCVESRQCWRVSAIIQKPMDETDPKITGIYDKGTVEQYYATVGKDVVKEKGEGADAFLMGLIPQYLTGRIVIDLGCGNGRYAEVMSSRGAKKVTGIDLSESMTEQAQIRKVEKQLDNVEIVCADMDSLRLASGSVDLVFARFSLMYTVKLAQVVTSLSQALSPKGEMLVETSVVDFVDPTHETEVKKSSVPLELKVGETSVQIENFAYSMDDYLTAFHQAGLTVEVSKRFPPHNLSIVDGYKFKDAIKFGYVVFKLVKE